MKIGIMTFHWATNYGAVLQTYATQTFLKSLGHAPVIINYKPTFYDFSIKSLLREFKNGKIKEYILSHKKEFALNEFRKKFLNQTERVHSIKQLPNVCTSLDCVISGSDQVMNVSFLTFGEGKRTITPSYFLGFEFAGKRIGYAVSFGTVNFPTMESKIVEPYIARFNKISTRESSGIKILESMGRKDAVVVPDPTILLSSEEYHKLADSIIPKNTHNTYCFFIRHISERMNAIASLSLGENVLWNNKDGDYSLEGWLSKIKNAQFVITDSFHCVVMCLKLHTSFVVVTDLEGNIGMNDRFYTLLGMVGLEDRIVYKENISQIVAFCDYAICWNFVDQKLNEYKASGVAFLNSI